MADQTIDPDDFPLVWSDNWLQNYTIALIKKQWGTNLSKYKGIALPGGVTLDGATMYTDAVNEIKDLEKELKTAYQLPIDFVVGGIIMLIGLSSWLLNNPLWTIVKSIWS